MRGGEAELDDVGGGAGDEGLGAGGDFAGAGGIEGGHADGVGEREAGETHQVFDAAVHVEGAAGETVGAGEDDAAVGGEIHRLVGQEVAAGRGAGGGGGIGNEHAAVDGLGADGGFQEGGAEVDAIDDEAGHQAVFGELFPDVVGVAAEEGVRAVAEVGGKGGSGGDGGGDLGGGGLGVADGGDHAFGGDALDVARMASGHSGERVTMRMRPRAASCQRKNSSRSGGRTHGRGWAPRGPSSGEMWGPSTWKPAMAGPSGRDSRAAARLRRQASMSPGAPVITVG